MSGLFTPIVIGPYLLCNRIIMAPMTRARAGDGGVPTELNASYYAQRASAGLIITESSQVCYGGETMPGNPGIHTAHQTAGWALVTKAVHDAGGLIFLQLWHGGRASHSSHQPNAQLPMAPSPIAASGRAMTRSGWRDFEVPRAIDRAEIPALIEAYRRAAVNAQGAGFDGVEIHAGNGFLIDQFLRDGSNKRTDDYGGSPANRTRFLAEVTEAVAKVWGASQVGIRISPNGSVLGMSDSDPRATYAHAVKTLNHLGLAYLHVIEIYPGDVEPRDGYLLASFFRRLFDGRIIANSGYDQARAEALLTAGDADMVSFGRPFIANPDLPDRFRSGTDLNDVDKTTIYGGDSIGYTDYPTLKSGAPVRRYPNTPSPYEEMQFDLKRVISETSSKPTAGSSAIKRPEG